MYSVEIPTPGDKKTGDFTKIKRNYSKWGADQVKNREIIETCVFSSAFMSTCFFLLRNREPARGDHSGQGRSYGITKV